MRIRGTSRLIAALAAIALAPWSGACRDDGRHPEPPPLPHADTMLAGDTFSSPKFAAGRMRDTIFAVDLLKENRPIYVVASFVRDSAQPAAARADLLQIYLHDTAAHGYRLALSDTLRWIRAYEVRDITGDRLPEVIAYTDAGGTDMVATRGMMIYSGHDGRVQAIGTFAHGNPEFIRVGPDARDVVATYAQLWPPFASHADAAPYLDDLFAARNGRFVSIRTEQPGAFIERANGYLDEYKELRARYRADTLHPSIDADTATADTALPETTHFDAPHPLFMKAALAVLSFGRGGQTRSVRSFWVSEAEYLRRRIPEDQFSELESIVSRSLPR